MVASTPNGWLSRNSTCSSSVIAMASRRDGTAASSLPSPAPNSVRQLTVVVSCVTSAGMPAPDQLHAELPTFDPLTDGFFDDPNPHYAELRARNPVHVDARGVTFCFAYDDVRTLLIDTRRTSMDRERSLPGASAPPTFPLGLLNRDPPDHTRIRKLMSRTFTPRKLELLMESMAALA